MLMRVSRAFYSILAISILLSPLAASATTPLPKPTCVISSPPGPITPGSTTRLIWYSEYAQRAAITPGIGQVVIPSGYIDVHPSVSTLYTMSVSNSTGSNTCGVLVTVAVQNPPTLLYYYPPVEQQVIFTPVSYTNVYVPYGSYGGYYVPYNDVYVYNDASRIYNYGSYNRQNSDFWSYYTRGESTGPSWFGETYSTRNMPYEDITLERLPNGDTRSITRECIDGVGCRITGMNRGWTVPEGESGPLGPFDDAPTPELQSPPRLLFERGGGQTEEELLAPPDWTRPGWSDSMPYTGTYAQGAYRASFETDDTGDTNSWSSGYNVMPVSDTSDYSQSYYQGGYGGSDPYIIQTSYSDTDSYYAESYYQSSYGSSYYYDEI